VTKQHANHVAGGWVTPWKTVRLNGVRFRIGAAGVRAIALAQAMLALAEANHSLHSLRGEIRHVRRTHCRAALTHLIEMTPQTPRLRLIAIWLRGQCGGYLGTELLAKLSTDEDEAIRAKVAGALQRMSGWSVLEGMARHDPSPRIRRIASQRMPCGFQSRLRRFTDHTPALPFKAAETPLYLSPRFEISRAAQPKSIEFIRHVLERIRALVRSGDRRKFSQTRSSN